MFHRFKSAIHMMTDEELKEYYRLQKIINGIVNKTSEYRRDFRKNVIEDLRKEGK